MSFQASDKVVCVDDKNQPQTGTKVVEGTVYAIRGFSWSPKANMPTLLLVGIHLPDITSLGHETGFKLERFRKLDELKAENAAKAREEKLLNRVVSWNRPLGRV